MRTKREEGWGQLPRMIAKILAGINLGSNESKVLWSIIYKTIAFNKIEDRIPGSQLIALTGIEKRNMYRAVNSLLKKGVILKKGSIYGVQRDLSKWEKVSVETLIGERCQYEDKKVSVEDKKVVGRDTLIRTSKRAFQKKGLSTREKEEKRKEYKTGLAMLKEAIKRSPDRKRKSH